MSSDLAGYCFSSAVQSMPENRGEACSLPGIEPERVSANVRAAQALYAEALSVGG
ncbi:hypothetical protein [Brenneria alni]|uniref:hypothetical protein n=1 Tax=Brenneria alni TaxID=71656 RepID=UPI001472D738|nr:hypothetical protein [Brenneria alni]